ncbi:MAG: hypothetical protein WBV82_05655 [Myxococcaceae bacterium]
MPAPVPPNVELAFQQLAEGLNKVGLNDVDLMKSPWSEIEKGVARLLNGAFDLRRPDHQAVAIGLSAAFGKRLVEQDGAFYAQNRESPDGMILGFPEAIIMLSPVSAVMEALTRSNLARLEDVLKEIRTALGRARLAPTAGQQLRLGPDDYERLFDPAFVQFIALDAEKLKEAWDRPAGELVRNLRDALGRTGGQLPPEVRTQIENQLINALGALDPQTGVMAQIARGGRLVEFIAHLVATTEATRPAPEEFWGAVVLPLLFIGAPAKFPPLDEDEREALKQGVDPMFLYLDVVPYQMPAVEDGLLGAIPPEDIGLLHPSLGGLTPLRLLAVKLDRIGPALEKFDGDAARRSFESFCAYAKEQTGIDINPAASQPVLNEATALINELRTVWNARTKGQTALRRVTESEAAADAPLATLRKSLHGPRIILA